MEKPAILKYKETEEKLLEIINKSELPAFVLLRIIEKLYNELALIEQNDFSLAKQNYEEEMPKKKGE